MKPIVMIDLDIQHCNEKIQTHHVYVQQKSNFEEHSAELATAVAAVAAVVAVAVAVAVVASAQFPAHCGNTLDSR